MIGWTKKKLGEVCTLQRGFDLPKKDRALGSFPLMSSSGCIDYHAEAKVKGPGVITGRSGSIGHVFYIEEDFWPLNTALYVKDFHRNDPKFVFYLLKCFDLKRFSSGTGVPTLNRNHVHDEIVFVPNSVEEQKRIVEILDQAYADIERVRGTAEKNLANAKELFDSCLQQTFSKNHGNWNTTKLKSITSKIGSGATPKGGKSAYKSEGMSLIRSMNVYDRQFKEKDLALIDDEQASKLSNVELFEGDVLLNITGASVARCCVVPDHYLPARVNQHVSIIRVIENTIKPELLCYLLTSKYYKESLLGIGEAGSTRQAITKTQIENFEISFPNGEENQIRFIKKLSTLEDDVLKLQRVYSKKLEALDELKKSILQKAFNGNLTKSKGAAV